LKSFSGKVEMKRPERKPIGDNFFKGSWWNPLAWMPRQWLNRLEG
jgi:hypothetical protein